jgi:hypothetical protein
MNIRIASELVPDLDRMDEGGIHGKFQEMTFGMAARRYIGPGNIRVMGGGPVPFNILIINGFWLSFEEFAKYSPECFDGS